MLFPLIAFVVILIAGRVMGKFLWSHVGISLMCGASAFALFVALQWQLVVLAVMFALVDIALILIIFRGDIQIR